MKRLSLIILLTSLLYSCTSRPPSRIDNACAIFAERNGFFNDWHKITKRAEARYGIPMPIILATIRTESAFRTTAQPKRTKLLGFIPWKRTSSAYGYSQALNHTWWRYQRATGHYNARRSNFANATDFIGWYHHESVRRNGVNPLDAYHLYLNYALGHQGYRTSAPSLGLLRAANKTQQMARLYEQQLLLCGLR